jgi:hypothetical protein
MTRRYRAELRMDTETVVVKDDDAGRVIARCDNADDASMITAALNDDEGAVALLREALPFVVWPPGTAVGRRARWAAEAEHVLRERAGG